MFFRVLIIGGGAAGVEMAFGVQMRFMKKFQLKTEVKSLVFLRSSF